MKVLRDLEASKKYWLRTPLTEQWEGPKLENLIRQVEGLLQNWKDEGVSPFSPDVDAAVLDTVSALHKAGAFWFNNGILPPNEIASNWPFHLKELEWWAVKAKAERVGLSEEQTTGYVCGAGEGHEFCIRAALQDIRRAAPTAPVTLVAGQSAHAGVQSAAEMLGVRLVRVQCGRLGGLDVQHVDSVLDGLEGAAIVVATWRSMDGGGYDDVGAMSERLSRLAQRTGLPALLHLDAARCFDDVTTLDKAQRRRLGLPRLVLGRGEGEHGSVKNGDDGDDGDDVCVRVATVVAGGVNVSGMGNELVVALKPRDLGAAHGQFVECVTGSDSTISGSRDALGGALVALHEARFGVAGLQHVHQRCRWIYEAISAQLTAAGVPLQADARGLDLVIDAGPWLPTALFDRWGARRLADGAAMLTVQPACTARSARRLLRDFGIVMVCSRAAPGPRALNLRRAFPVPRDMTEQLRQTAAGWRVRSAQSCGYPGNHSTLSVLGTVVGHGLATPHGPRAAAWTTEHARELLDGSCAALDVDPRLAQAAFTSGSTASNRIGLLTALSVLPHATIYASAAAHYSIAKLAADHEQLRATAVVNVPVDALGRMVPRLFAQCLAAHGSAAADAGKPFAALLLASAGTTFSGATDDLLALHDAAAHANCRIDYIHLDGALDLGASMARYTLGPPGADPVHPSSHRLVVQGVSLSQHKFPGLSVAGQVVCWAPPLGRLIAHHGHGHVDRRAVFELWLYRQLVSEEDAAALYDRCLANAHHLRTRLQKAGIPTLFNSRSLITLVQRQPSWLIARFNLSPEGDWVHCITMPHITLSTVDQFVDAVVDHDRAVTRALVPIQQHIASLHAFQDRQVTLKQLHGAHDNHVASLTRALLHGQYILSSSAQAGSLSGDSLNSTLRFAAVDDCCNLLAALLCQVSPERAVKSCTVLISESAQLLRDSPDRPEICALADLLVGSLFHQKVTVTQVLADENIQGIVFSDAGYATGGSTPSGNSVDS